MWRQWRSLLRRAPHQLQPCAAYVRHASVGAASSASLSIWRRKKEMGKEGLMVAKELKRLHCHPLRFERFMKTHVSRLLKSDLVAVLAEFQRQNLVSLSMKIPGESFNFIKSNATFMFGAHCSYSGENIDFDVIRAAIHEKRGNGVRWHCKTPMVRLNNARGKTVSDGLLIC